MVIRFKFLDYKDLTFEFYFKKFIDSDWISNLVRWILGDSKIQKKIVLYSDLSISCVLNTNRSSFQLSNRSVSYDLILYSIKSNIE